jgi:oxygen-independent coproporphyrinogen-3 oxidase
LLREFGVSRMSMGVQSIYEEENNQLMRHQPQCVLSTALDALYQSKFECVNLDLIYGIPGQSVSSWVDSIDFLLRWAPQEIFLYPLYQRPLTGLAKRYSKIERNDLYFKFYEAGKKVLEDAGYQQLSTRAFRHSSYRPSSVRAYSCQEDGMIGIGCGARSYTRNYHYSEEYSVNQSSVRAILQKYIAKSTDEFMYSHYGVSLSIEDVKRRYLIQSIMQAEGLDVYRYAQCFQAAVYDDFPGIRQLLDFGLASDDARYIVLNSAGMKLGDVIGPWFMSDVVKNAVSDYIYKG